MALKVLTRAREVLAQTEFKHDPLDQTLRAAAQELGLKAWTNVPADPSSRLRAARNAPPLIRDSGGVGAGNHAGSELLRPSRSFRRVHNSGTPSGSGSCLDGASPVTTQEGLLLQNGMQMPQPHRSGKGPKGSQLKGR